LNTFMIPVLTMPCMPNVLTKPSAMMSIGMQSGTAARESISLRPKKYRRDVKKATGIPTAAAISVEPAAILNVYSTVPSIVWGENGTVFPVNNGETVAASGIINASALITKMVPDTAAALCSAACIRFFTYRCPESA